MCICMVTSMITYADGASGVGNKEYELWVQSPTITSGLTYDDIMIYKALELNMIELLPLAKVGTNYYLAICSNKMEDGGYNNNSDTTEYYFYTLRATDTGFIILSSQTASNEYYWDGGYSLANISSNIDSAYYTNKSSEIPYYIMNPKDKYTNSNWDEYDEYYFITSSGKLYKMSENAENGTEGYPFIKDKILYKGQNKYQKSTSVYPYYYMEDGSTQASNSTPILFKNGNLSYGTAVKFPVSEMTSANGYSMYKEEFTSNISIPLYYEIPGSNNLFFTQSTTKTKDSSSDKYYYNLNLTIYRADNGIMTKVKSQTVPTKNTSSTFSPQKIVGLNEIYYTSKGLPIPSVTLGHYAVIARDGTICGLQLDTATYNKYVYPCTYNGHYAVIRSYNGTSSIYKTGPSDISPCYWQVINEITFDASGNKTVGADKELKIKSTAHSGQNGYFTNYNSFTSSNFTYISSGNVKAWWGRTLKKYFPDGRYVSASWLSMGGDLYELWYNIYNPDGTLRASGPTGYSKKFSSSFDAYDLLAWAVNDSKFIVSVSEIDSSFLKEYYRVAVVEESDNGEITSKVDLGEKTITPPATSDTEVVQDKIDFSSQDLPLGYNIKENVIDTEKLDALLRDQVNSIRLNDIVILIKEGYQGEGQNTGVTLSSYSSYDYSFGSSYVRIYTNGQYFRWYCYNPEDLTPGTYPKTVVIGDKTIYVTFKIVQPPTNEGSTTVVF